MNVQTKISYKLIAAVAAVAIAIIGVFAYVILNSHQQQLLAELERSANQLSETVKSSTRYDMLLNQRESVHRIINTIGNQQGIEKVRVYNKDGAIIYSTDSVDIGQMVDKRAEACYACHAANQPLERLPISERTRIFQAGSRNAIFGIINPIYNEPSCWQSDCHAHSSEQKVLGVLDITMSLAEVESSLRASQFRLIVFAVIAIAAISLMIYWLVKRMVLTPVRQLVEATQRVAGGDLEYTVRLNKRDEIGKLAHSFNDMTRKLAEAQRQLFQSDKLASVGRLAAGVAHEINNPLTGILTYSSFLLKRTGDQVELKDDLEVIVRETKRCRDIVKGLLDFARQSVPEKREVGLNDVVNNAARIVQNQLALHHIRLELNVQLDLPAVHVDANQIQQVLVNLLVNAGDAMPKDGGKITLTTALVDPAKAASESSGGEVKIIVSDNGCGIPRENLSKIFDPFFTTKGQKGNGLGLAIAWGIIDKHSGRITVDSEVGQGTTFTIVLPVAETNGTTLSLGNRERVPAVQARQAGALVQNSRANVAGEH